VFGLTRLREPADQLRASPSNRGIVGSHGRLDQADDGVRVGNGDRAITSVLAITIFSLRLHHQSTCNLLTRYMQGSKPIWQGKNANQG
jgi:hypothetical protein